MEARFTARQVWDARAARALLQNTDLPAREIAERALKIAADICIFTNGNIIVETV